MDMGFSMNGCKRALHAVGGSDIESVMNWIFQHNTDPDFNDPLPEQQQSSSETTIKSVVNESDVMSLVENLGCFTIDQVRAALTETNGSVERAADWLFSHMDDLDTAIASLQQSNADSEQQEQTNNVASSSSKKLDDGPSKYKLFGLISHIGNNTGS